MDITQKTDQTNVLEHIDEILDSEWLKSTFIIKDSDIVIGDEYTKWIRKNRYFSTCDNKFTSTAPGMSIAVNPKPQYTRYCDPRSKGRLLDRPDVTLGTTGHPYGLGLGRYYSEAIDDNQQRIYLRFGVPKHMPLLLWMIRSFDVNKVVLQGRGVITSTLIEAIGIVTSFFAFTSNMLLSTALFISNIAVQNSRYYSVKDTMYTYWATVESLLNSLVARRTMLPHILSDYTYKTDPTMNREAKIPNDFLSEINKLIPDVVDPETGRISVFAIALRAQAAYNKMKHDDYERNKTDTLATDFTGYADSGNTSHNTYFTTNKGEASFFTKYLFDTAYKLLCKDQKDKDMSSVTDQNGVINQNNLMEFDTNATDKDGKLLNLNIDPNNPDDSVEKRVIDNAIAKKDTLDKYKEYLLAELSEGGAFAVFNVENTGSVGESFSNSFGSNPISSTFNSISSKVRNVTDILSSAADVPIVGDALKLAADAGATILSKSSYGLANPLLALAYGVNVTMPKIWESSSASLPRASYKMKLISPYGNPYSQLFNIYLPLSMIMAGSLPRSTGASSYAHPFFCQLFDRGRVNINLGMIDSVSITRGTSNLGFSRSGHPNAIDIDFSVANMDEIVALDINESGVLSKVLDNLSLDFSETPLTDYLNTITGVDVYSQIYRLPMIRLKIAERYMNLKAVVNPDPAAFASLTAEVMPFSGALKVLLGDNQAAMQDLTQR